ncbi:hypothetical protein EB796_003647 [Bugula neritina]|uniref:Uncharacterized protein n=1 Tax=Bugula neritina TaxID=10212 RepID=A0A7J7KIG4_BUGNE|nr:hypothetical protein EB796_003647 [Bugula neritina]
MRKMNFESEDLDWLEHCYFSEDSGDEYNKENIPVKKGRILKPKDLLIFCTVHLVYYVKCMRHLFCIITQTSIVVLFNFYSE